MEAANTTLIPATISEAKARIFDFAMQLQPLRPDLSGIYHLKYNDQNWAFSLISLQGCYLRIAKIIIDHHNYKEIEANHLTKYFSEKFIQVKLLFYSCN